MLIKEMRKYEVEDAKDYFYNLKIHLNTPIYNRSKKEKSDLYFYFFNWLFVDKMKLFDDYLDYQYFEYNRKQKFYFTSKFLSQLILIESYSLQQALCKYYHLYIKHSRAKSVPFGFYNLITSIKFK